MNNFKISRRNSAIENFAHVEKLALGVVAVNFFCSHTSLSEGPVICSNEFNNINNLGCNGKETFRYLAGLWLATVM